MRGMIHCLRVVLAIFVISGCSTTSAPVRTVAQPPDYWPTKGWHTSTPEEQGMDSERLAKALDFIQRKEFKVHSLTVIRNGYIVTDAYFYPYTPDTLHDLASVTKSITSTLIGIAIDEDYIQGVHTPLLQLFPGRDVANVDADKEAITLKHVLMMSSGLDCHNEPNEITLMQMMQSPDWVQFMLDLPMRDEPGTRFEYCSGGTHLLSAVVGNSTGMKASEFAGKHLFDPLGISRTAWPVDPQGLNNFGWGSLRMKPHDMAKIGHLYLNDGMWDGERIVSSEWISAATSKHVALGFRPYFKGYGYQWWIGPRSVYSARGRGGQMIFVAPEQNMVVVLTGGAGGGMARWKRQKLLNRRILTAVRSENPLPPNPEGVALLRAKIRQAAMAPQIEPAPVPPMPDTAVRVSGDDYAMEPNPYGFRNFALSFERPDEAELRMSMISVEEGPITLELPVGLDNVYRIAPSGRFGLPAALKGSWKDDRTFIIDFDEIGNINQWRMITTFDKEDISIVMEDVTGLAGIVLKGRKRGS